MDRETSSVVFTRSDGKEARFPLGDSPFAETSALSRLHVTPSFDGLLATTRSGDDIVFELPKSSSGEQLAGRLVVYLDQNQWSAVASARHDPAKVADEERDAARQLAEWVQQRKIVLPASSGHYYETTKRFDEKKRYALGLTVLQLSRGWQMRDPVQVRRDELHDAFCSFAGTAGSRNAAVFTLMPDVLHGHWRGGTPYVPPADLPPDAAFQHQALTSATALIDVMLDAERIEPGPDTGWAMANQQFSDWLDGVDRTSQQKRKSIDALLLSDLRTELAEEAHAAGGTLRQFQDWLPDQLFEDIPKLPTTGVFREMLHERHLNKGTVWRHNDLTDMVYLSCAAGYADFVVCERHMGNVLTQGLKRLRRPALVFRRLRDAVPAIEERLAGAERS
ncbi:hypothetical protein [Blastococcus colisei]|nr:hypothetical protein [Blastococcus colisei]